MGWADNIKMLHTSWYTTVRSLAKCLALSHIRHDTRMHKRSDQVANCLWGYICSVWEESPPNENRAAALARTHLHDVPGDLDIGAAADDDDDDDDDDAGCGCGGGGDDDVEKHVGDCVYVDATKMLKIIFILMLMILKFRF